MTVRPGSRNSPSGTSSKPTCAMLLRAPSSKRARRVPSVSRFCALKIAVGGSGARSELTGRRVRVVGVVEVGATSAASSAMPCSFERLAVPAAALQRGVDRRAAAEESDPAVPGGDQVRDRLVRAAGVVAEDGVGVEEARRAVEEHERDAAERSRR